MTEAYIVAAVRTAGGKKNGQLSGWHPVDLSAQVINALVQRTGADPAVVEDVIWGCVSQTGEQGINIGRNAVLASCLPQSVPGTSLDRQCGSSQQALHFAAQALICGVQDVVIAGGVESMSRIPMFSTSVTAERSGLGSYISPTLKERFHTVFSQFVGAQMMADKYGLTRDDLDTFSLHSHRLASAAIQASSFAKEILPVQVRTQGSDASTQMHTQDEGVRLDASLPQIQSVKPLQEGGVITAANASQICDGASGVMMANARGLKTLGVTPLARIHHMSVLGSDPVIMLETPIDATQVALKKAGMRIEDIDLYEVNEAFACVPLAWLQAVGADAARLNVNGGAIALGHPLGASGTKLMTTLIHALAQRGARYGLQTMCEGGGMANVTIVERLG